MSLRNTVKTTTAPKQQRSDVAPAEGLEPPTYWFEARYSIQLSYAGMQVARYQSPVARYESCKIWHLESGSRLLEMASPAGVEPTTFWSATKRSIH